jgi:hypothetical protein
LVKPPSSNPSLSIDVVSSLMRVQHQEAFRKNSPAGFMHERLLELILQYQDNLSDDVELGCASSMDACGKFTFARLTTPTQICWFFEDSMGTVDPSNSFSTILRWALLSSSCQSWVLKLTGLALSIGSSTVASKLRSSGTEGKRIVNVEAAMTEEPNLADR